MRPHLRVDEVTKKISSALISVYNKDNLEKIIRKLHDLGIKIFATGGTQDFIEKNGIPVIPVESITDFPSIFGGRVKTLHPIIFGGILNRRDSACDMEEKKKFNVPDIDLVIVDLYPFEKTLSSGATDEEVIEKIDIGGVSLLRAAAKNFNDVLVIPSADQYEFLLSALEESKGITELEERKKMAAISFSVTSHYDTAIFNYFNDKSDGQSLKLSFGSSRKLRYGENPHQSAEFYGDFEEMFDQLHGKEISFNNILDIDAAVSFLSEYTEPTVAIIKHNNACGLATAGTVKEAWFRAFQGDPVSAFGGVICSNRSIDAATASEIGKIFFEVLIAPSIDDDAMQILTQKKNRIILRQKKSKKFSRQIRSVLNGVVVQDADTHTETSKDMNAVTIVKPTEGQYIDLEFANKIVKHLKSNGIVIARNNQLCGIGTGQTSRVDALQQAIAKAKNFGFDLHDAVMASDAFFPFPDCVEIAGNAGIKAIIQPGGSVKDQESIDYCNAHKIAMVLTGYRHFRH